jgi:hypothetical protein
MHGARVGPDESQERKVGYRPGRVSEALKESEDHRCLNSKVNHREMVGRRERRAVETLEGPPGDRQDRGGSGERPGTRSDSALVMRRDTQVPLPRQDLESRQLHESTSVAGQQAHP